MTNTYIEDKNGNKISCETAVPKDAKAFVIVIHGFGSRKESDTAQMMLRDLPEEGYGVLAIDLPGHGASSSFDIPLTIENCLDAIAAAESYLIETYEFPRIYYFASSFGAYLTLIHLSRRPHTGDKAFLRSAAVNMPELFTDDSHPELIRQLEEQGYLIFPNAGPAPVRLPKRFFEEIRDNDLFKIVPAAIDAGAFDGIDISMIHGECDETIDPAKAISFAGLCGFPIEVLPGEDHTLSTDPASPKRVSKAAIGFFSAED